MTCATLDLSEYLESLSAPLIIVAHPDDEVVGMGGHLDRWQGARFIHVTDGAPEDTRDALAAGCACRPEYAALRARELDAALATAGFNPEVQQSLGLTDQGASNDLAGLTRRVAELIQEQRPEVVITHPYEGGHPDHDAVAFAVSLACTIARRDLGWSPSIIETTFYHIQAGLMQTGEFIPYPERPVITVRLSEQQRRFKQRLLDCYSSQHRVLQYFQLVHERFRLAPRYDFTQPPHPGTLFYEQYSLGMDGARWRRLAAAAIAELGLGS